MYSFDLAEIEQLQSHKKWDKVINLMVNAAQRLERANVGFLLICINPMHKLAEEVTGGAYLSVEMRLYGEPLNCFWAIFLFLNMY